ncbi:MAG TPA: hypothetical protein VGG71_00770 [Chitinophagaceae bacterium]
MLHIKKPFRVKIFWLLSLLPIQSYSQDLTGIWTGFLQIGDDKLPYELVVSGTGSSLKGYSLMTFTFNGVENIGIKTMELKMKRGSISVEDGDLIYDNYSTPGRRVKLYGNLAWVGKDTSMTLAGTFATRSLDMRLAPTENSFKGMIHLQKKNPSIQTKLISKLEEMNLLSTLSFAKPEKKKEENFIQTKEINTITKETTVAPRRIEIIQAISFHSDSLMISLYDNGEIDGDTVSIILNGKTILSKQGLTAKAITKTILTSELGDSSELIMYAENLGRIPPNTGLLIVQDGNEKYYVRFSGDLQNNSAIILRRKK